jgi:hypothetical protein
MSRILIETADSQLEINSSSKVKFTVSDQRKRETSRVAIAEFARIGSFTATVWTEHERNAALERGAKE